MAIQMIQHHSSSVQLRLEMEVKRIKLDIEGKDQILAQRDQSLKRAEQVRAAVAQKFKTNKQRLRTAQSRTAQLLQERNSLKDNLEQKEMELQALRKYATDEREKQQRVLSRKEEEITYLRKQLAMVTDELERMKSQLPSFQEELQKVQLELAKKSTEVQMLREAKEEMKSQLEVERKRVDGYLMQKTAARSSDANYRKEVEVSGRKYSFLSM